MTNSLSPPPSSSLPSPTELDTAVVLPAALETGGILSPDVPSVSTPMTHEEALKEAVRKIWVPMWQEADTGTVLQLVDETVFELGQAIAAYLDARGAVLCVAEPMAWVTDLTIETLNCPSKGASNVQISNVSFRRFINPLYAALSDKGAA